MKIYVASKFTNAAAVRSAIGKLMYAGHSITFDWTTCSDDELRAKVAETTRDPLDPALQSERDLAKARLEDFWLWCANKDVEGVRAAQVFVLLPVVGMKGAWMELGIALSCWTDFSEASKARPRIFIVGEIEETVFVHHDAIERVESIDAVIEALRGT